MERAISPTLSLSSSAGRWWRTVKGRVFVTHNTKDFSVPNGDQRLPHPDIAHHFSRTKSRYFIKLVDALRALRPQQFAEAMYEHELSMEPRTATPGRSKLRRG